MPSYENMTASEFETFLQEMEPDIRAADRDMREIEALDQKGVAAVGKLTSPYPVSYSCQTYSCHPPHRLPDAPTPHRSARHGSQTRHRACCIPGKPHSSSHKPAWNPCESPQAEAPRLIPEIVRRFGVLTKPFCSDRSVHCLSYSSPGTMRYAKPKIRWLNWSENRPSDASWDMNEASPTPCRRPINALVSHITAHRTREQAALISPLA